MSNPNNLLTIRNEIAALPSGMDHICRTLRLAFSSLEISGPFNYGDSVSGKSNPQDKIKYIVWPANASGVWAGHANEIAVWNTAGKQWEFHKPQIGQQANLLNDNDDLVAYVWNGTEWVELVAQTDPDPGPGPGPDPGDNIESSTVLYRYNSAAIQRTVESRLRDRPTVGDFANLKTACMNSQGMPLVIPNNSTLNFTVYGSGADFASLPVALNAMRLWTVTESSTINLSIQAGKHVEGVRANVYSDLRNVNIVGATPVSVSSVSCVGVTTVPYNWTYQTGVTADNWSSPTQFNYYQVTYSISSTNNVSIGDFIVIRSGGSTNSPTTYMHYGAWEITNVDTANNRITVINFCHQVPPSSSFTTASAQIIRSVILVGNNTTITGGNDWLHVHENSAIGTINNLAIAGRGFPTATGYRGPFGYSVGPGYNALTYGIIVRNAGLATLGANCYIGGFANDNIVNEGKIAFSGITGNGWGHCIVNRAAGIITGTNAIVSGGWLDGLTTQDGGVTAGSWFLIGNARNGITHSQGVQSASVTLTAVGNGHSSATTGGINLIADARLCGGTLVSMNNIGNGVRLNRNVSFETNVLTASNNGTEGVFATQGSRATIGSITAANNDALSGVSIPSDIRASIQSTIILPSSVASTIRLNPVLNTVGRDWGYIGNSTTNISFACGTSGNLNRDIVFTDQGYLWVNRSANWTVNGSGVAVVGHFGGGIASMGFFPGADNQYLLGTGNNRFTYVYAVNGVVNTSDLRDKKEIESCQLGIDYIKRLSPISFKWITSDDEKIHFGLGAQDVKRETDNYIGNTALVTGSEIEDDRYGILYHELIPILINSIKQLSNEIDLLKKDSKVSDAIVEDNKEIEVTEGDNDVE